MRCSLNLHIFIWLLTLASNCFADSFIVGRIVGVTDGDTLVLLDDSYQQHKLRLSGIDAPEKGQPFGQASKKSLSSLAFKKLASANCSKIDRYKRMVCVVTVEGKDVSLEQIRLGMAWHYKKYANEQKVEERTLYAKEELEARDSKRGLWVEKKSMPPWEWRKLGRR
jgi:endonuclease YncB( thermonuclease family)